MPHNSEIETPPLTAYLCSKFTAHVVLVKEEEKQTIEFIPSHLIDYVQFPSIFQDVCADAFCEGLMLVLVLID